MTAKEIRNLKTEEIEAKVTELKKELFDLRFQLAVGQLEDTAAIGNTKKTIARMKTIINERKEA